MTPTKYEVVDCQTGKVVGTYTQRQRARNRADKMDMTYGAYRYSVRPVYGCPCGCGE